MKNFYKLREKLYFYYKHSEFLKNKYGEKVYKIPVNVDSLCPNVDGQNGCFFCSKNSISSEMLSEELKISEQLKKNINYIGPRYGAKKFIAYFQNGTGTFLPLYDFKRQISQIDLENIVGVSISTRPDCISKDYLDFLKKWGEENKRDIFIELGLQSVNHKTLKKINRGHSLAEFIDAVLLIKLYGFNTTVHVILNLPFDELSDIIEMAKILSSLKIDTVKAHSLYISKGTEFEKLYLEGKITICNLDEYIVRASEFLAYLDSRISVERLLSRAPKDDTVFCNYNRSWWTIHDMIEEYCTKNNISQGCKFDYLGGKQLSKINKNS